MKSKGATIILSTLLYGQAILGLAAIGIVAAKGASQASAPQLESSCVNALTGRPCIGANPAMAVNAPLGSARG